jgi:hypothetical protein
MHKEAIIIFYSGQFKSVQSSELLNYCENTLARHFSDGFLNFLYFLFYANILTSPTKKV